MYSVPLNLICTNSKSKKDIQNIDTISFIEQVLRVGHLTSGCHRVKNSLSMAFPCYQYILMR